MSTSIAHERICVEEILPEHEKEHNSIYNSGHSEEHVDRLRAAFFAKKLWPANSKILISFIGKPTSVPKTALSALKQVSDGGKIDPLQTKVADTSIEAMIKEIVEKRIQPLVNLKISFVDDVNAANVRVSFDPDGGCWSLVGTDHAKQKKGATMNFGWFDVGTVIHEFGHTIGMVHEHQNPRGEMIQWDKPKVYKWASDTQGWDKETTNQNIIKRYDVNSINGSSYDPLSIMLYFFPASLTTDSKGSHQNLRLSGLDTLWINKMYNSGKPNVPSQFYKTVYGENINTSIAESRKDALAAGTSKSKTWIVAIIVIVTIIVIIGAVVAYIRYRKYKSAS
jgi:hypothetical protein